MTSGLNLTAGQDGQTSIEALGTGATVASTSAQGTTPGPDGGGPGSPGRLS
ncbi:MAG TPA: hypothetical protein VGC67_17475 [Cellulomonas sp.]